MVTVAQDAGEETDFVAADLTLFAFTDVGTTTGVTMAPAVLDEAGVAAADAVTGSDFIDFSSYDVVQVLVDGTAADYNFGVAATAGQKFITLVESTTNDGEYLVTLWQENGATDDNLGVIGTLDFGAEQQFVAENFIL